MKSEPLALYCGGVYYPEMAESKLQTRIYTAALGYPSGLAFSDFLRTTYEAASEVEAIDKGTEWALKHGSEVDSGTYLQISIDGRGIHSEKLGWVNPPRGDHGH